MKKSLSISDAEWSIMKVLWEKAGLTLKEIAAALPDTGWSYTTVRTLVTRLAEKGAISADRTVANNFKYFPEVSETECKSKEVKKLIARVFDGSASMLVSALTGDSNLTEVEKEQLLKLIARLDEE